MRQFVAYVLKFTAKYTSLANIHNLGTDLRSAFQVSPSRSFLLHKEESSRGQALRGCLSFLLKSVRQAGRPRVAMNWQPRDSSILNLPKLSFWNRDLYDPLCGLPAMTFLIFFILLVSSCKGDSDKVKDDTQTDTLNTDASINITLPDRNMDSTKLYSGTSKAFLIGLPDLSMDSAFVDIPIAYASRKGMQLQKECLDAFIKMADAALKEGITLKILSATRNFKYQKGIWERKWNGQTLVGGARLNESILDPVKRALKILEYSSMPGSSRHHWGTDFDINAFTNSYFESGEGKKLFDWMETNAANYGFCRPYTEMGTDRLTGYFEEKWHWSYMPLAKVYTMDALKSLSNSDLKGFLGAETAQEIGVIENYIGGISPKCLY